MDKTQDLIKKTKGSITIEINGHKDCYETIEQYIEIEERNWINRKVWDKMIELNTCIRLQVYPNNPIGFYVIYHYDLEKAIEAALNI